jgi:hypothetical protein
MIRAILLMLLLSGCAMLGLTPYGANPLNSAIYGVPDAEIVVRQPQLYTRAEIDAINAEAECRRLARTMVQAQRCGVRR